MVIDERYEEAPRGAAYGRGGAGGGGYVSGGYEGSGGRAARYVEDYDDGYAEPAPARYVQRGGGGSAAEYEDRGYGGPERTRSAVPYERPSAGAYAKEEVVAPRAQRPRADRGYEGGGGGGGGSSRYEPY